MDYIQSLSETEWCLLAILRKACAGLRGGITEIDLRELGEHILTSYGDEGIEKWQTAFDDAARTAIGLFAPHPDSQ